jgi:hypothetical protein
MPVLSIRDERADQIWQVWPEAEPIPPGAIRETGRYLFELNDADDAADADLMIDDQPLEALRCREPRSARWRWSPGFHAGTVDAELRLPGAGTRRFEIVTDPDLRKLTRDDFDQMVREILEDTFALFSLSGFRKSVAKGTGRRPPAIARLEFLRSRIAEIESAVQAIAHRPRRKLTTEEATVPYHQAIRATGPEIQRSFRSGRILAEKGKLSRLPRALGGFLPERIRVQRRRSSFDLPEHRQIAACLRSWADWLTSAAELLDRGASSEDPEVNRERQAWAARSRRLSRRLRQLTDQMPFSECGDAPPRLMLSSMFRNDPAYRRFFRLYQDMNMGIAAVFGDFLGMPLARTFELYELWCFLRLIRAAVEEYGSTGLDVGTLFINEPGGAVTIAANAVTVPVAGGWKLCFQRQYREFWLEPDRRGSFSRTMTPDVVVQKDGAGESGESRLIVLDAKYRIEQGLNAALNSIHTYRDALVREADSGEVEGIVTAAYLMAPSLIEVASDYRDASLPGRLFHPEYRENFRFGAITMRPGMTATGLQEALRTIVADATT